MLERNQRDGLSIEDRLRLQWFLGVGLTLIACWALSPLPFAGDVLVGVLGLVLIVLIIRPALSYFVSTGFLRIASPFIVLAVAIDLFLSAPDFLPAVLRMLVLLLFLRAVAMRSGREDLQLLLLSLFALILSGVMTASLVFAAQILLFALLAMPLLFLRSQTELAEELPSLRQTLWHGFLWHTFIGRVRRQLNWKLLGFSLAAFITLTLLSSLIFVLIPRFQLERTIQFFQLNTNPRSGFSESISLGYVTAITLDNSVALRVDGPGRDALPSRPYWRMLVLDEYRNGRFSLSNSVRISNDERIRRPLTGSAVEMTSRQLNWDLTANRAGTWVFYLEGNTSRFLPLPGPFESLRFTQPEDVFFYPAFHNLATRSVRNGVFSFRLEKLQWADAFPVDTIEADALAKLIAEGPLTDTVTYDSLVYDSMWEEEMPGYPQTTLLLPLREGERELLQSILKENFSTDSSYESSRSASAFSAQIKNWLGQRFSYSLTPDIPPRQRRSDPIVAWLREGSVGHCELFAGAFLLLAREAGFPARIVTGFSGGAWNAVENYFVVRNRNAHAWVEIYDSEKQNWLRIDPTPAGYESIFAGAGVAVDASGFEETGWMAWMDSLRILWYRRIVNFDHDEQTRLAEQLISTLRNWQQEVNANVREIWQALTTQSREWFGAAGSLGLPVLLIFTFLAVLLGIFRIWPWLRFSFNRKPALHPWRLKAGKLLRRLRKKRSLLRAESEHTQLYALEKQLEAIRFGPLTDKPTLFNSTFKAARRALRKL